MLENPYGDLTGGQWLRGNLHTHTDRSDGEMTPQQVINDYATRGYDFLSIADHDIFHGPDEYAEFDDRGMLLIAGNEMSARGPHVLHLGGDRHIESTADRQKVIDDVNATAGFVIVNHPNWRANFDGCPLAEMERLDGYIGMEIYNAIISRTPGSPYATNKWDQLLSAGRRLWGLANDDAHIESDVEKGWNMVYVNERSVEAVLDAVRRGRFYASSGVTIRHIEVDGLHVRLETDNAQRIVALQRHGQRVAHVDDHAMEVDASPESGYLRFECWGPGESFAWTQPMFVAGA